MTDLAELLVAAELTVSELQEQVARRDRVITGIVSQDPAWRDFANFILGGGDPTEAPGRAPD